MSNSRPLIKGSVGKVKENHKAYEKDTDGCFALWIEENRKSETHPNLTGHILIDGKYHWFNAYIDESLLISEDNIPF